MAKTWTEEGEERGVKRGQLLLVLDQLEAKFPPLSEAVRQKVSQLPDDKIRELGRALLSANSLDQLGLAD